MTWATICPKRRSDMRFMIPIVRGRFSLGKRGGAHDNRRMTTDVQAINRLVHDLRTGLNRLYTEIEKVIVGQRVMVDRLLMGLMTGGHLLIEGVPGLAKTL